MKSFSISIIFPDLLNKFEKKSRKTGLIAPFEDFSEKVIRTNVIREQGKISLSCFSGPPL